MDEARRVLERLESIERLKDSGAPAAVMLEEVRALLADGERWLATERPEGLDDACAALNRCRVALQERATALPADEEAAARTAL
jgi:hypothetical protein